MAKKKIFKKKGVWRTHWDMITYLALAVLYFPMLVLLAWGGFALSGWMFALALIWLVFVPFLIFVFFWVTLIRTMVVKRLRKSVWRWVLIVIVILLSVVSNIVAMVMDKISVSDFGLS